jgi:PRTRC genetic system protein C
VIVTSCQRIFSFSGLTLPDPDKTMLPEDVKAVYSQQYPELATASIEGPEVVGDKLRYVFRTAIGTKG